MKALKDLRRSLPDDDASYSVSKNTLTTIAAREAGVDGIEQHSSGRRRLPFIDGDPRRSWPERLRDSHGRIRNS